MASAGTAHQDNNTSGLSEPALLYRVSDAATLLGISRTNVYHLLNDGRLASVRIGHRRLIPRAALEEFVSELISVAS